MLYTTCLGCVRNCVKGLLVSCIQLLDTARHSVGFLSGIAVNKTRSVLPREGAGLESIYYFYRKLQSQQKMSALSSTEMV